MESWSHATNAGPEPVGSVFIACGGHYRTSVVTPRGNKYILVFVDYFTRWVETFAVASLDTISFVNAMIEGVICRHGVPERLLSERGSNFTSNLARSLYETLGIKKLCSSAYHLQTQGLVERFNGTQIGMLQMYVSETQTGWDVYSPSVLFAYRTAYHEGLGDTPFFSLYGRDPVLPIDLAFLNTGKDWKSNEVAVYRRKLYHSLRDSRLLVERQLIKAQDRHEKRLDKQGTQDEELGVLLARSYRIVGQVGENAYRVTIPSHPNKIVTVNVNRLKRFRGRWSRPFADEIPESAEENASEDGTGPLQEEDLPSTSFVERLSVGGEETAFSGVSSPIVDIVAKRINARELQYLVLTATYETFWLSRPALAPELGTLIRAFEDADRNKRGLPELHRNARLVEANTDVADAEVLFYLASGPSRTGIALLGTREDGTSAGIKIASPTSVGTHQERVPAATPKGTVRPAADDAARRGRRASVEENCHGPQLDDGLAILADCIKKVCSLQTLCTTSNQLGHPAKSSAFQV
ncbi:hypothetical protein PC117_g23813 [Phytophthora cactorum]|uniref:Integrase catalytic domain-containing protein n=2 Tax=Phytophthora cactorum TaxID=29920 RepID=A0A8T1B2F4_9STRA|nr:hypothetical protein PC117_g23813 [Phytophthora cactorum]